MPPSSPQQASRARRRPLAAAAVTAVALALTACGGGGADKPKRLHLTAKQNKGIETIAKNVQKYCVQGGAHSNIEREIDALVTAYQAKPTSIFTNSQGTESTMREVVSAVADELQDCGEEAGARKLRRELSSAG